MQFADGDQRLDCLPCGHFVRHAAHDLRAAGVVAEAVRLAQIEICRRIDQQVGVGVVSMSVNRG
jgi:hypothetical protein